MPEDTKHPLNAYVDHKHMYKMQDLEGEPMLTLALSPPPMGAGFAPEEVIDAVKLEVWNSTFTNPAFNDYSTFELYNKDAKLITYRKVNGY